MEPVRDAAWWDERYRSGQTGWDRPGHAPQLERELVRRPVAPGRALDLGCGRGRNARFLARQGFSVVGVDISSLAIADARASSGGLDCSFHTVDLLKDPIPGGPFDLVFDFGCLHTFDSATDRTRCVEVVAEALAPGGLWLSLVGCTDGPPRETGPPRRSATQVAAAVEPHFEILSLVQEDLHPGEEPRRPVWMGWFRRR